MVNGAAARPAGGAQQARPDDGPDVRTQGPGRTDRKHSITLSAAMFQTPPAPAVALHERDCVRLSGWSAGAWVALQGMLRELAVQAPAQGLGLLVRSGLVGTANASRAGMWTSTAALGLLFGAHLRLCQHGADLVLQSSAVADTRGRRLALRALPYALPAAGFLAVAHGVGVAKARSLAAATPGGVVSSATSSLLTQALKHVGGGLEIRTDEGGAVANQVLATAVDPWRLKVNQLAYALAAAAVFLLVEATRPGPSPDPDSASFGELLRTGWVGAVGALLLDVLFRGVETLSETAGVLRARTPQGRPAGLQVIYREGPRVPHDRPTATALCKAAAARTAQRQMYRAPVDVADAAAAFLTSGSAAARAVRIGGRLLSFPVGLRNWIQQEGQAGEGGGRMGPLEGGRVQEAAAPANPAAGQRPRRLTFVDGEGMVLQLTQPPSPGEASPQQLSGLVRAAL